MAKRSANIVENFPSSKAVGHYFSIDDFEDMSKGYRPKNTEASTSWTLKTFQTWMSCRNAGRKKSAVVQICCLPIEIE